ncbi:MAG TPA: ABC transporter permease [Bacteroidota bacterium]|nr:ABC transporter permease [Bacteroidota bacterium]
MREILNFIRKEFQQIRRDRKMIGLNFFAPIFQLIILGYAATLDVRDIPTIIYDMDDTKASRDFVKKFTECGYFSLSGYAGSYGDVDRAIDSRDAAIAVIIPYDFSNDLISGRQAQLQVIADGSETNSATIGLNYASMIVQQYSRDIVVKEFESVKGKGAKPAVVNPEVRVWFNPELKSRNFMVPGVLALLLMVLTMILTSLAIVKENEAGTMEQLIVTPIRPYQIIIGKLAPFFLIGFVDVILVLTIAVFWFDIPLKGSAPLLFVLCLVFQMTTLGAGLFVSTVSKTQQQAMLTAVFFVILPMMFLSGFVFPIENMPKIIQVFTYIIPLRYFFIIIRGVFLKGVGIRELWLESTTLLLFGAAILTLSILRFRRRISS